MTRHGKVYKDPREREKRFRIFNENVNYVEAFNNAANKPYKLGINQFETSPIRSSLRQEIDSRGICVPQSLGQPLLSMKMLQQYHPQWIGGKTEQLHPSRTKVNVVSAW